MIQYDLLISNLLAAPSGGLIPVLLTVAMLKTLKECYDRTWDISWQGINVSDRASGVGGDVTISDEGRIVLAIEITERAIERSRVVSTFNTKIVSAGIDEYLFVYSHSLPADDARDAARQYFTQGHEIDFVQIQDWIRNILATVGAKCRATFTKELIALFDTTSVPANVKLSWNNAVKTAIEN